MHVEVRHRTLYMCTVLIVEHTFQFLKIELRSGERKNSLEESIEKKKKEVLNFDTRKYKHASEQSNNQTPTRYSAQSKSNCTLTSCYTNFIWYESLGASLVPI